MVNFFEKGERSETLAQWRKSTEVRLKGICDEHKEGAKKHCNLLKLSRESRVSIDSIQKNYWQQLQREINTLAADAKQEKYSSKTREQIFNEQWQRWLQEISQTVQPVRHASIQKVNLEICQVLEEQYNTHGHLVTEKLTKLPLESRETLRLDIDPLHLDCLRLNNDLTKTAKNVGSKLEVTGSAGCYTEVNEEDLCVAKQHSSRRVAG